MGNGCGPSWMPKFIKALLFNWFFEASCNKHDIGYTLGGNEFRRWYCDYRFFVAMLHDVCRVRVQYKLLALVTAVSFYVTVMLFGWMQFNYKRKVK